MQRTDKIDFSAIASGPKSADRNDSEQGIGVRHRMQYMFRRIAPSGRNPLQGYTAAYVVGPKVPDSHTVCTANALLLPMASTSNLKCGTIRWRYGKLGIGQAEVACSEGQRQHNRFTHES
jgi:hypothetical protein